jgi:hypothetical protein
MPPPPSGVRWGKLVISTFQSRQFGNRRFDIRYFGSRNNPFYLTNPSIRNFRKLCSKLSKTLFETFENFVRNLRKLCSELMKTYEKVFRKLMKSVRNLWKLISVSKLTAGTVTTAFLTLVFKYLQRQSVLRWFHTQQSIWMPTCRSWQQHIRFDWSSDWTLCANRLTKNKWTSFVHTPESYFLKACIKCNTHPFEFEFPPLWWYEFNHCKAVVCDLIDVAFVNLRGGGQINFRKC